MPDLVEIEAVTDVTDQVTRALVRLVPQLSPDAPTPTAEQLRKVIAVSDTTLLVARDSTRDAEIVGTLTLVLFRIPTGIRAHIEDVVVDESVRGKGIAEALCRHALQLAVFAQAQSVDITSRPVREAANRLYRRLGFRRRDTNVYRYDLTGPEVR
jgi:ribosomal protein S18 acetylase RimI-like enzyme